MRNQTHREITRLMTQMRRLCSLTINKRLAAVGCTLHEYGVLFRLVHDAEVPQYELAYDAAIDPAAASRLVRTMVRAGLVTTHVSPTDKRQRFVTITPKGRALERTLSPVVDAALEPLLAGLTPGEDAQFLALLRKAYEFAASASGAVDVEETRSVPRTAARPRKSVALGDDSAKPPRAPRRRSA